MKGILLINCLFLAVPAFSSASEIDVKYEWNDPRNCKGTCPAHDNPSRATLLQHNDCDKYCLCNSGKPIVMLCPPDLHYNPRLQVCDYPENAHCSNESDSTSESFMYDAILETATQPWQNPNTCKDKCPQKDDPSKVTLLENQDCTKYCMCHVGTPAVLECPAGLIFSYRHQTCTWPYVAECPQRP